MTTQIKFRGFRTDGKGWVDGDLIQINGKCYISPYKFGDLNDTDFGRSFAEIHPSSLGQFTGQTDKNGKEIFGAIGEKGGDVVQSDWGYGSRTRPVVLDEITYAKIECTISDNIEIIGNQFEQENGR